jgi:hypothetical protein
MPTKNPNPSRQARPVRKKSTFKCPDCGSVCAIYATKELTPTYKEFYTRCKNTAACEGSYVFGGEPVRVLVVSKNPNPALNLPMHRAAHSRQEKT